MEITALDIFLRNNIYALTSKYSYYYGSCKTLIAISNYNDTDKKFYIDNNANIYNHNRILDKWFLWT